MRSAERKCTIAMFFYQSMDFFFTLFGLVFIVFVCLFIYNISKGVAEWHSNNQAPQITVAAKIVGKRHNVDVHHHNAGNNSGVHTTTSTTYYVTFELEDGQRLEFQVKGRVYGLLAEGDCGTLSYQGTRYLIFERNI